MTDRLALCGLGSQYASEFQQAFQRSGKASITHSSNTVPTSWTLARLGSLCIGPAESDDPLFARSDGAEVAIKEFQGDLWMGAVHDECLKAEVLLLLSCTTELLIERLFNGVVPCRVAEPVSAHRSAA